MNSNFKKTNIFGLTNRDTFTLHEILKKYPDVQTVLIFGSRAKGNYQKGSDIDLAIINDGVKKSTVRKLKMDFEESSLPYFVDIIDYQKLKHVELKEHIDRIGMVFYQKNK